MCRANDFPVNKAEFEGCKLAQVVKKSIFPINFFKHVKKQLAFLSVKRNFMERNWANFENQWVYMCTNQTSTYVIVTIA